MPSLATYHTGLTEDTTPDVANDFLMTYDASASAEKKVKPSSLLTQLQGDGSGVSQAGFRGIPQNSKSANYTTVMSDAGQEIFHPSSDANARTFTIDSNANVAYPIGTAIMFTNDSANAVTIAITSDTLVLEGAGTTGSRTLAQYGSAVAKKKTSTRWYISGTNLT